VRQAIQELQAAERADDGAFVPHAITRFIDTIMQLFEAQRAAEGEETGDSADSWYVLLSSSWM